MLLADRLNDLDHTFREQEELNKAMNEKIKTLQKESEVEIKSKTIIRENIDNESIMSLNKKTVSTVLNVADRIRNQPHNYFESQDLGRKIQ